MTEDNSVKKKQRKKQENRSGNPNGGPGRPKGVPNKLTGLAKENIATVFGMIGGVDRMASWAEENLTEFYKHYARLVPVQVQGDKDNPLQTKVTVEFVGRKNTDT